MNSGMVNLAIENGKATMVCRMKEKIELLEYLKDFCTSPPAIKGGVCEKLAECADVAIEILKEKQKPTVTFEDYIDNNVEMDNRHAEPKDIMKDHYHLEHETVSCPHCTCTLSIFTVRNNGYCYVCGGKFGNVYHDWEYAE